MKSFNEYYVGFNEKKIGAFLPVKGGAFHFDKTYGYDIVKNKILHDLFLSSYSLYTYPSNVPYISFHYKVAQQAIDQGFPRSLIINPPDTNKGTLKMEMHKKLEGKSYVPTTVYTKDDISKKLTYPIIGKSAESQAAQGVYKFDNEKELNDKLKELENKDKKEKIDFFCNAIKIKQEWRTVCWKRKNGDIYIIYLAERIVNNDKIKSLRENTNYVDNSNLEFLEDKNYESNFTWTLIDLKKEKISKYIKPIIQDCFTKNPDVTFLAIDFCIDDKSKYWWIECNCAPGASYNLLVSCYYHAMEDWYPGELNENSAEWKRLITLSKELINYTNKVAPVYQIPEFEPDIKGKKI